MAATIEREGATAARRGPSPESPEAGTLPLPAVFLVVAITAGVVAQGGYYPHGQRVMAAVLAVALAASLWTHRWSPGDSRLAPVRASIVLAAWAVVSATIAGHPAAGGSTVAILSGVVAVLLVCRRTTLAQRDTLMGAAVAVGVVAATSGWVGVAWRTMPWALEDGGLWRAATVLTYANATAGLLVPMALIALSRLVRKPRAPVPLACAYLLLVGVGATLSRAGIFAFLIGVALLLVLLGWRRVCSAAVAPTVGAAVALLGLAPSMPSHLPARPAVAAVALVAGLVIALGLARIGRRRVALAMPLVVLTALVVVGGFAPLGRALSAIGSPRLSLASPDRTHEVRAAIGVVADHPITGAGPGQAILAWSGPDGDQLVARYAHNEYLQTAAEMGLVGLALLLVLLAALGRSVWRGRGLAPAPELWAGAVAGLTALAFHSAFDFLWHVPVIPLVGALLVGTTLQHHTLQLQTETAP